MSSSLGFRRGCDHIADSHPTVRKVAPVPAAAPVPKSSRFAYLLPTTMPTMPTPSCGVFKGFVPTLLFAALAGAVPILLDYVDYDFSDNVTRGVTIGLSAAAAVSIVYANDCVTWYNMALFFHTGVEVQVVHTAIAYARADTTTDEAMALAIAGAAVVIVHLLPFYLVSRAGLLSFLAAAGVAVNTSIVVFLYDLSASATPLLLVGASSLALLAITLLVLGMDEHKPAMLGLLLAACKTGMWIGCASYTM